MWERFFRVSAWNEAAEILHTSKGTARIIGGGTDLLLEIKNGQRIGIDTLVDVSAVENSAVVWEKGTEIHIGPSVTHAQVAGSALLHRKAFPLVQASSHLGSPQIRNAATLVGNLITASPGNDTITPLMALGGQVSLLSLRGERRVPLKEFYTGLRSTIMEADELLTGISFPSMTEVHRGWYVKLGLRKSLACSVLNAAVVLEMNGESVESAAVTMGAVAPVIIRSPSAEKILIGKQLSDEIIEAASAAAAGDAAPIDDIRSSAEYRRSMVPVLLRQALLNCRDHNPGAVPDSEAPVPMGRPQPMNLQSREQPLNLTINGKEHTFHHHHTTTLIKLLRTTPGLAGTKESCGEGECGACTVLVDGKAVLACLTLAASAAGKAIETVESIGNENKLHPLQQAFIEEGAVQCGYCTPGFLMAAYGLLKENPVPEREDIIEGISGNICRCTGYYKIIRAVEKAAVTMAGGME